MSIIILNDQNFEQEVLKNKEPVLVDFYADWCPPCKVIAPFVEKLAQEYEGKIKVCKINVDQGRQTAMEYGINSIPNLIFFNKGEIIDKVVGAVPYEALVEKIEQYL